MIVALIGSGGREHALAKKICESNLLKKLYCIPGNPGTALIAENILIDISHKTDILDFCLSKKVDLVIIGPEKPLADGLSDFLRANKIKVFGPNSDAAAIESHKAFSKNLMTKYKIPTAAFIEFNSNEIDSAKSQLIKMTYPLVIKADGLAAGKGVIICKNLSEANNAIDDIFETRIFGDAGNKIIIEEFMFGQEASVFAITDGEDFICLPAAQDHKRIGNNDTGKNTGGMGAYAPAPLVSTKLQKKIEEEIILPVINAMKNEGKPFSGCLYAGLMITDEGPKVVEFNCRFGDPETQSVLPLLKGDFLQLLYSVASGKIDKNSVEYNGGSSVCVVISSGGYPDDYESGYEIDGIDKNLNDVTIYHAGTKISNGKVVTSGGRVLGVTSFCPKNDLEAAKEKAYKAIEQIKFKNMYYRNDIADKGIRFK
jgi:phosphoribosylamine--glycine ligase